MKRGYYPEPHHIDADTSILLYSWEWPQYIRNYEVPPLHWNRYTREGRALLRKAGMTVKEAWLHPETL